MSDFSNPRSLFEALWDPDPKVGERALEQLIGLIKLYCRHPRVVQSEDGAEDVAHEYCVRLAESRAKVAVATIRNWAGLVVDVTRFLDRDVDTDSIEDARDVFYSHVRSKVQEELKASATFAPQATVDGRTRRWRASDLPSATPTADLDQLARELPTIPSEMKWVRDDQIPEVVRRHVLQAQMRRIFELASNAPLTVDEITTLVFDSLSPAPPRRLAPVAAEDPPWHGPSLEDLVWARTPYRFARDFVESLRTGQPRVLEVARLHLGQALSLSEVAQRLNIAYKVAWNGYEKFKGALQDSCATEDPDQAERGIKLVVDFLESGSF